MISPLAQVRRAQGLSQAAFANAVGVHVSVIRYAEHGCYQKIPPSILEYVQNGNTQKLLDEYNQFRAKSRAELRNLLINTQSPEITLNSRKHPFIQFREGLSLSRRAFAILACVSPTTLFRYETGYKNRYYYMPQELADALLEVGMPLEIVAQISLDGYKWNVRKST